ncbi:MAG: redoxin domain-containing protein [Lentimicrobiaceae bacterium]|jgi:thiol-disulfide isomerase/thioredoxin|nr:redoxin domain-containing protein [Lentimicrobiaceae bacterium]MDD4598699.1 redoxin domain-containing protein [Lentimicrobiaceae bacterium]MDY0026525.1 redoxin domain-containing protein [Lentimicrobium sp.]HAH57674.1 hypothetical protein [Bacteroidales bacterium]
MKKSLFIFALLLITIVVNAQTGIDTAVDFTVKDLEGNLHHLYDYLDDDKLVVIDFFTTNCGPCQKYASEVSASYEHFGCNEGNVIYLGINWGSDNEQVAVFDSLWGANYPTVSGLQGGGNGVVELYGVMSYPSVILIAPDRSILHNYIWPPQQDTINIRVNAAGGIPMSCAVTSSPALWPDSDFKIIGNDANGVIFNINKPGNQQLNIYAANGRLVRQQHIKKSINKILLKAGFYIAVLQQGKAQRKVIKFMVN